VVPLVVAPPSAVDPKLAVGPEVPTPSVRPGFEVGGWQVLLAGAVGAEVVGGGVGAMFAPPSIAMGPLLMVVGTLKSMHLNTEGQSESTAQVATLGRHDPGKDVVVTHTGSGMVPASAVVGGASGVLAEPVPLPPPAPDEEPPPLAAGPELEQVPMVAGWHAKPSPQSKSTLQGRSHV